MIKKASMSQQSKNNNQNRNARHNPRAGQTSGLKTSRAGRDEEALGSDVFDYSCLNKMNQFNKTLEAIISHIGRTQTQALGKKESKQKNVSNVAPKTTRHVHVIISKIQGTREGMCTDP